MAEVSVSIGRGRQLTAMQRSLWASQAKSPASPHQNTALLWHIEAELDLGRLGSAFAQVVEASDVLRTTIVSDAGKTTAVLSKMKPVTEQLTMSLEDAQVWASSRAAITMDATVSLYDSVTIDHQDGTVSWFLNLHHAITDATSSASVFGATAAAYAGDQIELDSYYDWADAQANDDRTVSARTYWDRQSLSPKVGRLYGQAGSPSPAADRMEVGIQSLRADLDQLLAGRLASLSEDLAWTSFLLTTTAVLIHRTSGADSFSIGLPLHNRAGAQAQAIIGPAMEVFPVAIEIESSDTFASLHKRISRSAMATIRKAKPGSAPNQVSFETIVNVIPRGGVTNFGAFRATTSWVHPGAVDPSHLLRVQLTTYAGGPPRIELDVNHAVGTDAERQRVPAHFNSVLAEFVSNPDAPIGSFPLLDLGEIETVTAWGTGTVHGTKVPDDVVSQLEASLMANGGVALTDGHRQLTGPDTWRHVSDLAGWLISEGVVPGVRVGIEMERTVDAVLAIYAVLAAGGSYVPLDPSQPESRRKQLIERAGCELVLRELPAIEAGNPVELPAIGLQDEAYLLFTSGSTGEPKGVPITHLGLADYLDYARSSYLVDEQPPFAALFTPLTFDLTVTTLFMPLLAGGRLLTVAPSGLEGLIQVARAQELTWLKATPSHLELLLRLVEPGHQLKSLVVGGEAFTARLARQLWLAFDEVSLFNEYGPTEAVVGCMYYKATESEIETLADVPIGKPAPGITLAVVDEYLQPVPVGAVGELLIASRGLTAGYLASSDGTDPGLGKFVEVDGFRYYRSGDLVRLVDPETLVYHGRADSQIKVGGIRLEPTEVEAELEAHPAIRRAAARIWTPTQAEIVHHCVRCGLPSNVPDAAFDSDGVCSVCHDYDRIAPQATDYFGDTSDLMAMLAKAQADRTGDYDCIHLLSGGKDSTFALYRLVELGFKVFALTFDNGFISEGAKDNARASAADLGVDHEILSSEFMNEIFADSLARHSNVCHGCYKTIYTLATTKAEEIGAPIIFTGLSRGQLFETRLIPAQFTEDRFDPVAIDSAVVQARRVYHQIDDGPNRLLDNSVFDDGTVFDRVSYVDYYRYTDVSLAEMLDFLENRAPWVRPSDTGRSTNCLVNAAGIHTHITEQGYHNYAEPYAWDVRLGHKTRDEAIEELDDQLDLDDVASMLAEIGYTPKPQEVFTGWIELEDGAETPSPGALRAFLADRLPKHAIPAAFVTVDELPTSANGKLDEAQLPRPVRIHRAVPVVHLETLTEAERQVTRVWEQVLNTEPVGIDDDFFALGGDSLAALEMVVALSDAIGQPIPEEIVFSHTTPRGLAGAIASVIQDAPAPAETTELTPSQLSPSQLTPSQLMPWQQSFVFEHMNDPDSGRQNVGRRYVVRGKVDVGKLAAAVQSAVERHVPLRTTLGLDDHRILPAASAVDIAAGFSPVSSDQLDEIASAALGQPFDIENGPLLRVAIHPMVDGSTGVVIVAHHGVSDLDGTEIIWTDIDKAYRGVQLSSLEDTYSEYTKRHLAEIAAADTSWIGPEQIVAPKLNLGSNGGGADGYVQMSASFAAHSLGTVAGATPMAALLAGLAASLRPLSPSDTLSIALPVSARAVSARDSSASELAGCWLNVVPIQIQVEQGSTYRNLSDQSGRAVGQALSRRMVPPATVNRIRRSHGLAPVDPQVTFAFSKFATSELGGLQADHEVLSGTDVRAPIAFFAEVRGESVRLGLEYSGDVLSETEAQEMLARFDESVVALISSPHALALGENDSKADRFEPLASLIGRFAVQTPDALAVADGTRRITYAGLSDQANGVAQQLAAAGVGIGDKVGVFAPRSAQTAVGIVGVLTAGAAYVALDPDYPTSRLRFIATDGELRAVVAARSDAEAASELGLPVVISDSDPSNSDPTKQQVNLPVPSADDPAYLIYTSGSTGQPKGVVVSHGNIVQSTQTRTQVYGADPKAFLLLSSFSFDSSMVGLFWSLTTGGALVLPEHGLHTDVIHLASVISDMKISHLLAVPALYRVLLEETDSQDLIGLKAVIVAGEACSAELVTAHFAKLGSVQLHNEYGPTETTVWSHHYQFPADFGRGDSALKETVPIGTSIPGVDCAVVDEAGLPVAVGAVGELLIGGFGVTGGYQNRPKETAARFVAASEYSALGLSGTLYRTGDLVRLGANGLLSFVGRVDRQVKVRGFRVEPELIEAQLMSLEGVSDAAVDSQDGRLVAWVATTNSEDPAEPDRIKAALVGQVPSHEIPAIITALELLPRTVNGKVDRTALPSASVSVSASTSEPIDAAADPKAGEIAQIWADVLGLESVGLTDNFFDLGGDSILNIRIVARMRQAGFEVRPRDVFNNPTVDELASLLSDASGTEAKSESVPMAGLVPLLEMQRWFFNQKFADPNHWTQSLWAGVNSDTDFDLFEAAIQELINYHDILRSRFLKSAGSWTQFVADAAPRVDLIRFEAGTDEAEVATSVESTLDIEAGRLIAVGVLPAAGSVSVFVAVHHLVIDGVSWAPLLDDWTRAYEQLRDNQPVDLGPIGSSQADWARAISSQPLSGHWPVVTTHNDERHPVAETLNSQISLGQEEFNEITTDRLEASLVSAVGLAWCEIEGLTQFEVTLESHGRDAELAPQLDLTRTLGWFTSQYPVAVDFGSAPSPASALVAVSSAINAVESLGVGFDSGSPDAQIPGLAFNYLGQLDRAIPTGNLFESVGNFTAGVGKTNHRPHRVGVVAWIADGELVINWDGAEAEISQDKLDRLARATVENLKALSATPDAVSDIATTGVDATTMAALGDLLGGLES